MKANITVKQTANQLSKLGKAMRALTRQDVFIGVPEDKDARSAAGDTGISNAYLAYIHEHGVPENNLPARPALMPGIKDIQADAAGLLKKAAEKALEGEENAVPEALNKIGLLGQNAVRAKFVDNDWPALSDKTLDRRPITGTKANKKGEEITVYGKSRREKGRVNPLIDTGQLRKSYTYVIRDRGGSQIVKKGK